MYKFNGYHSGGRSFVNVNDCWLLQKLFVYHRYKFSFEKKNKESQYMVSHPETGSDSSIGSDRDRGCDIPILDRNPVQLSVVNAQLKGLILLLCKQNRSAPW